MAGSRVQGTERAVPLAETPRPLSATWQRKTRNEGSPDGVRSWRSVAKMRPPRRIPASIGKELSQEKLSCASRGIGIGSICKPTLLPRDPSHSSDRFTGARGRNLFGKLPDAHRVVLRASKNRIDYTLGQGSVLA